MKTFRSPAWPRWAPDIAPWAAGCFAFVAQTLQFRLFFNVFEHTEIGIAVFFVSWLAWSAAGAVVARLFTGSCRHPPRYDVAIWTYLPAYLLQQALVDHARLLAGVESYAIFPFPRLLVAALWANAPLGLTTGWLFTRACSWLDRGIPAPASRAYMLDALGCASGGLLATLALAAGLSEERVFLAAASLLGVSAALAAPSKRRPWHVALTLLVLTLLVAVAPRWTRFRDRQAWARRGLSIEETTAFSTARARYHIGRTPTHTLILSGESVVETLPSEEAARTAVALHLAQRPGARRILIIGAGSYGLCRAFLECPSVESVEWLHPDPDYPPALFAHLPATWLPPAGLRVPARDIRRHLRLEGRSYDLIILDLGDPLSLSLNRYMTDEFLALLHERLGENGVLSVLVGGADNVLSPGRLRLGAIWKATLSRHFPHLALLPGESSRWFASRAPMVTEDAAELVRRWRSIPQGEAFYPADALATWFPRERIRAQRAAYDHWLATSPPEQHVNRDARPLAVAAALAHAALEAGAASLAQWLLTDPHWWLRAWVVGALAALLLRAFYHRSRRCREAAASSTGAAPGAIVTLGVAAVVSMGYAVALMYLFQVRHGTIFLHVGLLSAASMLGVWAGNALARRCVRHGEPRGWLPFAAISLVALVGLTARYAAEFPPPAIALAMIGGGLLTGLWVPTIAARLERADAPAAHAGALLQVADSFGAALGGLLCGLFLLPILGIRDTLAGMAAVAAINLAAPGPTAWEAAEDRIDLAFRRLGYVALWILILFAVFRAPWEAARATSPVPPPDEALEKLATAWNVPRPYTRVAWRLPDGREASVLGAGACAEHGYVLTTDRLGLAPQGFGGPMTLALWVGRDGTLRALQVVEHQETPSYYALTLPWQRTLLGRRLTDAAAMGGVDTVTGATISSGAILRCLEATGELLRLILEHEPIRPPGRTRKPSVDAAGPALLVAAGAALTLRRRPSRTARRVFLLLSVILFGFLWNAQASMFLIQAWLTLRLPQLDGRSVSILAYGLPAVIFFAGNVYCGWLCPYGALQEIVGEWMPARWRLEPDRSVWRWGRQLKYLAALAAVIALMAWPELDVAQFDPLVSAFQRPWTITPIRLAAILFILMSLVSRRYWCRQWCPTGAVLSWISAGLRMFDRWRPRVHPRRCDLGVRHVREMDCLACDRCRDSGSATCEEPDRPARRTHQLAYAVTVAAGGAIWVAAMLRAPAGLRTVETRPPLPADAPSRMTSAITGEPLPSPTLAPVPPSRSGQPAPVNRIRELQRQGRLSDREARFYERLTE